MFNLNIQYLKRKLHFTKSTKLIGQEYVCIKIYEHQNSLTTL